MKRMALGIVFGLLLAMACAAVTNTDSANIPGRCVELSAERSTDSLKVLVYDGECRDRTRPEATDKLWAVPAPFSRCDIRARFHTGQTQLGVQRGRCEMEDSRTEDFP